MENCNQYCHHIKEQTGYYQCDITTRPCVASNYKNDPQYLKLEKICDCPGRIMPEGLAKQLRDLLRDSKNDFAIPADYFDEHTIR